MWSKLSVRTVAFVLKTNGKFQAKDRRMFRGGMAKWKQAIDRKKEILDKKEADGLDIKAEEIADHKEQHLAYNMIAEKAATMDIVVVGPETDLSDPTIIDTGYVQKLGPLKEYTPKAGKPSTFTFGVRSILDSPRAIAGRLSKFARGSRGIPGRSRW